MFPISFLNLYEDQDLRHGRCVIKVGGLLLTKMFHKTGEVEFL
jgi:hypothetical protein